MPDHDETSTGTVHGHAAIPPSSEESHGPGATPERRRFRRLRAAALLALVAGLLGMGTSLGWWARGQLQPLPPPVVTVTVDRPVVMASPAVEGASAMPSLYGLSEADARQALLDAGADPGTIAVEQVPAAGESDIVVAQEPAPGETLDGPLRVGVSVRATMPELVGQTEDDAREALDRLGARVQVESDYDPAAAEGAVLATRPAAGEDLTGDAVLIVAAPASSVLLTQLSAVSGDCDVDDVTLSGTQYGSSLVCAPPRDGTDAFEYVLNRRIDRFEAVLGQPDRAATGAVVVVRVLLDGAVVSEEQVAFGEAKPISVPVTGGLRLRVETVVAAPGERCCTGVRAALGEPRLLGDSDAVDALVAESRR